MNTTRLSTAVSNTQSISEPQKLEMAYQPNMGNPNVRAILHAQISRKSHRLAQASSTSQHRQSRIAAQKFRKMSLSKLQSFLNEQNYERVPPPKPVKKSRDAKVKQYVDQKCLQLEQKIEQKLEQKLKTLAKKETVDQQKRLIEQLKDKLENEIAQREADSLRGNRSKYSKNQKAHLQFLGKNH